MAFYTSPDQTITSGGTLNLNHGLGVVPKMVQFFLVCQTADNGYSVGDVVAPLNTSGGSTPANDPLGLTIRVTSTQLQIQFGASSQMFCMVSRTAPGGAWYRTPNSFWKIRFVAQS